MDHRHPAARQDVPFLLVHVHAVRGNHVRSQHAQLVKIAHRRHPEGLHAILDLLLGFGHVDMEAPAVVTRKAVELLQVLPAYRVNRVGSGGNLNHGVLVLHPIAYALLLASLHFVGVAVHIGHSYRRPDALLAHGGGGSAHGEVHVVEEDRSAGNHLVDGHHAAFIDLGAAHSPFLGPYMVLQPGLQRHVVRVAAKNGHGRVVVGIVEGRKNRVAVALYCGVRIGVVRSVDRLEAVSVNQDIGRLSVELDASEQSFHFLPFI